MTIKFNVIKVLSCMSLRQDHELSNLLVQSIRSVSVSEKRLTNPSPNPALTRTCYPAVGCFCARGGVCTQLVRY